MLPITIQPNRRSERIKQRIRSIVKQHYPHSSQDPDGKSTLVSESDISDDWITTWVQQTTAAQGLSKDQSDLLPMAKGKSVGNDDPNWKNPSDTTRSSIRSWGVTRQIEMEGHGILMNLEPHKSLNHSSQKLYHDLLCARYPTPTWFYSTTQFQKMLHLVGKRSEASMIQHLTPMLVPSPETLQIEGAWDSAQLIAETWGSIWTTKCATLLSILPKPDVVLGISHTAFTTAELAKLRGHNMLLTVDGEQIHYPFLVCEVKGRASIAEAELQAMHAASTAINAILHLCRHSTEIYNQLSGQVLGFSLSHNSLEAKLYGHFALIDDHNNNMTFHRCELYKVDLATTSASKTWTRPYQIILAICEHFFPLYLQSIKAAIATLPDAPTVQALGIGDSINDEGAETPTAEIELQREVGALKRQLEHTTQQRAQQGEQMTQLLAQMEQQRAQQGEQIAQLLAQMEQQRARKDEQMAQVLVQMEQERAQKDERMAHMMAQMVQGEQQMAQVERTIQRIEQAERPQTTWKKRKR